MNAPNSPESASPALCPIARRSLPRTAGIILCILLGLSSAMIGLGLSALFAPTMRLATATEIISLVVSLLQLVYLWRVCRSGKGILPLLILAGGLCAYLSMSLIPGAVMLSIIFTVGEGATLIATIPKNKVWVLPLIPILAYAAVAALTWDLAYAVTVLLPVPPVLAMAFGTRDSAAKEDGLTRVGVICLASLSLLLSLLGAVLLFVYRGFGTLDLLKWLEAYRLAYVDLLLAIPLPEGVSPEIAALFTPESLENLVNTVFNLLPAVIVITANLLTAVAQMVTQSSLRAFGFEESVTDRVRTFKMSLISCLVFTVSYFIVMFSDTSAPTLASVVATNIYLILLPGLALAGLLRIAVWIARKREGGGCLFFLVFLLPVLLLIAPLVLAIVEVIGHVYTSITSRIKPPDDFPFDQS